MSRSIRRAKREDIPGIVMLEKMSMGPLWSDEGLEYEMESMEEFVRERFTCDNMWVMEDKNGDLLAFLHSTNYKDAISSNMICEIYTIIIHPEHFGKGIGGELMEHQRKIALEEGMDIMKLEVLSNNHRAIRFYNQKGFQERKKVMAMHLNCHEDNGRGSPDTMPFPLLDWLMENKDTRYDLATSSMPPNSLGDVMCTEPNITLGVDPGITVELEEAIGSLYGDEVHVMVTSGTQAANTLVLSTLLRPGDTVLTEEPSYPSLHIVPSVLGMKLELLERSFDQGFLVREDVLYECISSRPRMVVLTDPHNPSGVYMGPRALTRIYETLEMWDSLLLVDEIYRDFLPDSSSALDLGENVLVTSSLSKVYGFAGLRIGWVATRNKELMKRLRRAKEHLMPNNSVLSERVALEIIKNRDSYLSVSRNVARRNLKLVKGWVDETQGVRWVEPARGIISFPRLDVSVSTVEFAKEARDKGVLVVPGEFFGSQKWLEGHIRLTFKLDEHELKKGLELLSHTLSACR